MSQNSTENNNTGPSLPHYIGAVSEGAKPVKEVAQDAFQMMLRDFGYQQIADVLQGRKAELVEVSDGFESVLMSLAGMSYMKALSAIYQQDEIRSTRGNEHWVTHTLNSIRQEYGMGQAKVSKDIVLSIADKVLAKQKGATIPETIVAPIVEATEVQQSFFARLRTTLLSLVPRVNIEKKPVLLSRNTKLAFAATLATMAFLVLPYLQGAKNSLDTSFVDSQAKAEASNPHTLAYDNLMWTDGVFAESKVSHESENLVNDEKEEVALGPEYESHKDIGLKTESAEVVASVSLSPAQIEAASPPMNEATDIREVGIERQAEREKNEFINEFSENMKIIGGYIEFQENGNGMRIYTPDTQLVLAPQDYYQGKMENAAAMVGVINKFMNQIGSLEPGRIYSLLGDDIVNFHGPDSPFIDATYKGSDGLVTIRGAGGCWTASALGDQLNMLNNLFLELGYPPIFIYPGKDGSITDDIVRSTNQPHKHGFDTYANKWDPSGNHGFTIYEGLYDFSFGLNPEFVAYVGNKGLEPKVEINGSFIYGPGDNRNIVGYHLPAEFEGKMPRVGMSVDISFVNN